MRHQAFNAWIDCVKNDRSGLLATVLSSEAEVKSGNRLFVSADGQISGSLGDNSLNQLVAELARRKFSQVDPKSETRTFDLNGSAISVFIDVHVPSVDVMIFGAGHDAIPVASFARQCGFRVTVVDQREAFATEERFPGARLVLARPEELAQKVQPDHRTFIVIMNHHLDKDRICLRFSLQSKAPYVGLLGPQKRCNRLLASLKDQGVVFSEETLSHLYNPVGLDIGAEGSEEIAVSIVSEMIAFKHGKSGGHLRVQNDSQSVYQAAEKR